MNFFVGVKRNSIVFKELELKVMNMVEILELGMGNPTKQIGRGKPSAVEAMGFSDYANYYILT